MDGQPEWSSHGVHVLESVHRSGSQVCHRDGVTLHFADLRASVAKNGSP